MTQYYMSVWEWKAYPHFMMNCGIFSSKKEQTKRRNTHRKKKRDNWKSQQNGLTAWRENLCQSNGKGGKLPLAHTFHVILNHLGFTQNWDPRKIHDLSSCSAIRIYHTAVGNKTVLQTSKDTLKIVADFHKVRDQGRGCARMVPKWVKALGCDVSFPMNKML